MVLKTTIEYWENPQNGKLIIFANYRSETPCDNQGFHDTNSVLNVWE